MVCRGEERRVDLVVQWRKVRRETERESIDVLCLRVRLRLECERELEIGFLFYLTHIYIFTVIYIIYNIFLKK